MTGHIGADAARATACETVIIDATATTFVSLLSFLGSGIPLSGARSATGSEQSSMTAPIPTVRFPEASRAGATVNSRLDRGWLQQLTDAILDDIDRVLETSITAQARLIDTARGVLDRSLYLLQYHRRLAQRLSHQPCGGRAVSDQLQTAVCSAVTHGARRALESLSCTTARDAAKLRATTLILSGLFRACGPETGFDRPNSRSR